MYTVLVDLPVHIPVKEIYRYMGYPAEYKDIPPTLENMVEEEIIVARALLLPKATYLTCVYNQQTGCVLTPDASIAITGAGIQNHLTNCTKATLFTCTVGSAIEPKIDAYFKTGEFTRAIILDAIGSAAVEYVADTLNQYLHTAAHRQQHSLVSRFSPGYGDWNLSIQQELVRVAGGSAIGIEVTESSLLLPRKSVSGIIGWLPGLDAEQRPPVSPCITCQIRNCKNPICKGG